MPRQEREKECQAKKEYIHVEECQAKKEFKNAKPRKSRRMPSQPTKIIEECLAKKE